MIANQRQYRITRAEVQRFKRALACAGEQGADLHPRLRQAIREGLESQLAELRAQLAAYEALRGGRVTVLELDSLAELPEALIRARIAAGLTQKQLAARLGLKEQQVQRHEATRYAGASLARVHAVVEALGVQIQEQVRLPPAATDSPPASRGLPSGALGRRSTRGDGGTDVGSAAAPRMPSRSSTSPLW